MPIPVVCSNCKTRFSVSEKFAGQKGPCPKCKTILTVPQAMADDIKVHAPEEFASGGKDAKGRAVLKPIARQETKFDMVATVIMVSATLVVLVVALLLRGLEDKMPAVIAGLAVVSAPLAAAGYTFLRDSEMLDPYRGKWLWIRAAICGLGYALLWAVYYPLTTYGIISGEAWQWLFIAPIFIAAGGGIALACFDLDYGSACLHYCFYVLVCLALRFALGLPPLWAAAMSTSAPARPF